MHLPYDSAISHLYIYLGGKKAYVNVNAATQMFTATFWDLTKPGTNQMSVNRCVKRQTGLSINGMLLSSKRNEILMPAT